MIYQLKIKLLASLLCLLPAIAQTQGVKISSSPGNPDPSSVLDVESTVGGFLPPRMSTFEREAISNPAKGLMIYNTDIDCMQYYRGPEKGWFSQCPVPPVITTVTAYNISGTDASSGGNISYDGGSDITARGVCWSTSPGPDINSNITNDGIGGGAFTSSITGLAIGTIYYYRAYATNTAGTGYGNEQSFTTLNIPALITSIASPVYGHNAATGGTISQDGGAPVTTRGVCWSLNPAPTLNDNFTTEGSGSGTFASTLFGMSLSSTYYARAYATNSVGTAYGNEISFTTTSGTVLQLTTTGSSTWSAPTGVGSGEVLVVGGGGGGGGRSGGGGGGGGVVYHSNYIFSGAVSYTVGTGGSFTQTSSTNQSNGANGENSVFGSIVALGGGGGGSYTAPAPGGGGSGGGGSGGSPNLNGATSSQGNSGGGTGYGNAGGNGHPTSSPYQSGGGGGAGGSGAPGTSGGGGNGGIGYLSSLTGVPTYYAGGGGGGSEPGFTQAIGGAGGGGNGSNTNGGNGYDGTPNTGGGGGGTRSNTTTETGGIGGSGIIIIRY